MTLSSSSVARLAIAVLLTTCFVPAAASASYTDCTQLNAPAMPPLMIGQAGVYCLVDDITLSASGVAIEIYVDDVTLDLNGHTITNSSGSGIGSTGIRVMAQRGEVRNGRIVGFEFGIDSHCYGGGSLVFERLQIDRSEGYGAWLGCDGTLFRHNIVTRTGSPTGWGTGIVLDGARIQVRDNTVTTVQSQGAGAAIEASPNANAGLILGNRLSDVSDGVSSFGPPTLLRCRDNVTADVVTPYAGCTDLGNNH